MIRWDITKLAEAVKTSECLADVCRKLSIAIRGNNYDTVRNEIARQGIDTGHFKSKNQLSRERSFLNKPRWNIDNAFVENSVVSRNAIKYLIKKHQLLKYKCRCGLISVWKEKLLVLQLDHINGIHNDNRIENLRWLCPNCHSQTDTFAGKKTRKITKSELNPEWRKQPHYSTRKVNRPDKVELENLIKQINNWSELGRRFGVSDNAVRKWAKSYKLI